MALYQIYWSPTGGVKQVIEHLGCHWTEEKISIDILDDNFSNMILKEDDICIIGVPVYGGRVPPLATSVLQQLHGHRAKTILVAVYGNRAYEDAL